MIKCAWVPALVDKDDDLKFTSLVSSKSSYTGHRNKLTVILVLHLQLHSIQAAVAVERGVLQRFASHASHTSQISRKPRDEGNAPHERYLLQLAEHTGLGRPVPEVHSCSQTPG